ncbi:5-formyltetrahydrofolate cyclo-ligase [Actibacterium sp. MT2.3-13A]|uniref:5-formyltetrahydrofolate cyclo-ligase n=1 Tax=Actibacterium sp. MT2.3-13A TaxID=2828332 RepID=UPI001BAB2F1B|nr:5-formyltetrahydrofolate cyclo-ligase [Actibacterium sp. MT2.3-13A]
MPHDPPIPASPPCFAHELSGGQPVDPQTARDVARFRKAERARLIAARLARPAAERAALADEVAEELDRLLAGYPGAVVGLYWPFRGELDLRGWMARAHARGHPVALPVVAGKAQPLVFREWTPGCAMARGVWNIPIPAEGRALRPGVVIAPLVGVDPQGYRLGYGGGFYDRTLAALAPRPLAIGVGAPEAQMPTIFPQPHDIAMDVVVLGRGKVSRRPPG